MYSLLLLLFFCLVFFGLFIFLQLLCGRASSELLLGLMQFIKLRARLGSSCYPLAGPLHPGLLEGQAWGPLHLGAALVLGPANPLGIGPAACSLLDPPFALLVSGPLAGLLQLATQLGLSLQQRLPMLHPGPPAFDASGLTPPHNISFATPRGPRIIP